MASEGAFERLYAPWRFEYVSSADPKASCIFCAAATGGEETLTLLKGERAFVLLNRFPYTSGHAMVAPIAHAGDLTTLDTATLTEVMELARRMVQALERVYHPHGFNVGFNLGEAAGAGIAEHLHMHIVPRWRGDTSFMTVSAGVRVMPEDLSETYAKMSEALGVVRG